MKKQKQKQKNKKTKTGYPCLKFFHERYYQP